MTITLPFSTAAKHIIESKIALGLIELPAIPGTSPAQQIPIILALYYAHAYPAHYYTNPPIIDCKVKLQIL